MVAATVSREALAFAWPTLIRRRDSGVCWLPFLMFTSRCLRLSFLVISASVVNRSSSGTTATACHSGNPWQAAVRVALALHPQDPPVHDEIGDVDG